MDRLELLESTTKDLWRTLIFLREKFYSIPQAHMVSALLSALSGIEPNEKQFVEERERLRQNTMRLGKLSPEIQLLCTQQLCRVKNPARLLEDAMKCHVRLTADGTGGPLLFFSELWALLQSGDPEAVTEKALALRKAFNQNHSFDAGGEEDCYLVLEAVSEESAEVLSERFEQCYEAFRSKIFNPLSLTCLSAVSAVWGKLPEGNYSGNDPELPFRYLREQAAPEGGYEDCLERAEELLKQARVHKGFGGGERVLYSKVLTTEVLLEERFPDDPKAEAAFALAVMRLAALGRRGQ